jgi:molecular chaperone GrpE
MSSESQKEIDELIEENLKDSNLNEEETPNDEEIIFKEQSEEDNKNILTKELVEAKDKYLRLYAEFDNFKKRTMKENLELRKNANQEIFVSLLNVLDDFERAKKAADEGKDQPFSDGVTLVLQKLQSLLFSKGLKPMESQGQSFDSECHEAITELPTDNPEMIGKVLDTIEKGYFLNDKIIRYAKVVVGK